MFNKCFVHSNVRSMNKKPWVRCVFSFLEPRTENVGYKSDDKAPGECWISTAWLFGSQHSRGPPSPAPARPGFPVQVLDTATPTTTTNAPNKEANNNSACPCKPKVLLLKAAYLVKTVCPHHHNLCAGKPETSPCLESNGKYKRF